MVAHPSYLDSQYELTDQLTNPLEIAGKAATPYTGADTTYSAPNPDWQPGGTELALLGDDADSTHTLSGVISVVSNNWPCEDGTSIGQDIWWGQVHVLPRSIALGNILSTVDTVISIFNADRASSRQWTGFVNNAGSGTEMLSLSLPVTLSALEGVEYTFRVTTDGPAQVNAELEYTFSGQNTIFQPISFVRLVVFPYRPEFPVEEALEWLTEIVEANDGTEQRQALREWPRQEFKLDIQRSSGAENQRLRNRMADRQELPWGLPVFTEETELAAAASINDTVITVVRPYISDFRVGQQLILLQDETNWESATISAISPTQITLSAGLQNNWPAGTPVMPMRTAVASSVVDNSRFDNEVDGVSIYTIRFKVTDNETGIGQTVGWNSFNSKVLLDDDNFFRQVKEQLNTPVIMVDNSTGRILQTAANQQNVARRTTAKRFVTNSRENLFKVRQLLYALRGRQVSFYLPTFGRDFTPVANIVQSSTTLDVANTGYSTFVQSRKPFNIIRVVQNDGTTVIRTVTSASEVDTDTEQLTVDSGWPANVNLADIKRIEMVELVRLLSDRVVLTHTIPGRASIPVPVKAVLD